MYYKRLTYIIMEAEKLNYSQQTGDPGQKTVSSSLSLNPKAGEDCLELKDIHAERRNSFLLSLSFCLDLQHSRRSPLSLRRVICFT